MNKLSVALFFLLTIATPGAAIASETLYLLVTKSDWQPSAHQASFRPSSLSGRGFIQLLPREQVVPAAQTHFPKRTDLLLLKVEIPFTDSQLKWENEPGSTVSQPRYYGHIPRRFITNVCSLKPDKAGNYKLPADPFLKRIVRWAIPNSTVDHFLDYETWQNTARLYKLQTRNFVKPSVQLQWWYFDFFLADGSSVVLAFIPQNWWGSANAAESKRGMFTMALRTKEGVVKRFMREIPQSEINFSAERLVVSSNLVIESVGSEADRIYSIRINFPEVTGAFTLTPTRPPFAAFPTGAMPGILMTLMSGADWGSPRFSYVSQIPDSNVSGSLAWGEYRTTLSGRGYHEQGRIDDRPERQGGSWMWYHFSGEGWSVFGSPGSYVYLQHGDRVLRSGFHAVSSQYTLQNRMFSSPDHPKILTGGEILFRHDDITFRLTISPATTQTLVAYAAATNPTQIWGTVGGPATLVITEGSSQKTLQGRVFLETCSWETRAGR